MCAHEVQVMTEHVFWQVHCNAECFEAITLPCCGRLFHNAKRDGAFEGIWYASYILQVLRNHQW